MNADGSIKHLIPEGGYIDETRNDKNSYTLRAQINFNRTFDEKHEVSAIAGGERRAVHGAGVGGRVVDFAGRCGGTPQQQGKHQQRTHPREIGFFHDKLLG